jgi:hypothetical protein
LINDGSETRMSEASIAQWRAIPVAVISEELNRGGTMAAAIKPVGEGMGFAGQALTARTMVGDNATLHYAVASAWPGCVIVVDARGHVDTAVWGGILTHAAQVKGVAALVVDGVVTGVCLAAGEPAIERRIGLVEHRVPALVPMNVLRRLGPEAFRVGNGTGIDVVVAAGHRLLPVAGRRSLSAILAVVDFAALFLVWEGWAQCGIASFYRREEQVPSPGLVHRPGIQLANMEKTPDGVRRVRTSRAGILWPRIPGCAAAEVLALQYQLEDSQWWPAEALLKAQLDQLEVVLGHALGNAPFYGERLAFFKGCQARHPDTRDSAAYFHPKADRHSGRWRYA